MNGFVRERLSGWGGRGHKVKTELRQLSFALSASCLLGWGVLIQAQELPPILQESFAPPAEFKGQFGKYPSLLVQSDGQTVRTPAQWQHRREQLLGEWEKFMGPWPPLLAAPKLEVLSMDSREELIQKKVRVDIAPGQTVDGYLLIPPGARFAPAVLVPYYEPETSIGLNRERLRDFGYQLAKRGFVTLSIGSPGGDARNPVLGEAKCQPLSFLAYVAANCHTALAQLPQVNPARIGIVGHSYGGKWAMFAACLYDKFACGVWSDPGIVFDEPRPNVNYWDRWYLGSTVAGNPGTSRGTNAVLVGDAYRALVRNGHDLTELLALMAPRPFLVSGGSEDPPARWEALNRVLEVYQVLGVTNRVAMTTRKEHSPDPASNAQVYAFFEHFLK